MQYITVIGLEIHCELATKSKIFCSCPTTFGKKENENVCPICMGMPGTLPVLNKTAVAYAVKAGLALGCKIARHSKMDRKNYFYPDLPKAYQISQFDLPLCREGYVDIQTQQGIKRIGITRIHLEEDAGKLVHGAQGTHLDFNRCGVPLIELVSEPDMRSAEEALAFATKVRNVYESIGVSDCKMEQGSIRFDVNLSVMPEGADEFGTRTEMKNLNSFRSLVRAIEYEQARQIEVIETGGKVEQETRKWDDDKGVSISLRTKENAQDYRYFPDPDLVAIRLDEAYIENLRQSLPELLDKKAERFEKEYGLSSYDAMLICSDYPTANFFEESAKLSNDPKLCVNFITGDIAAALKKENLTMSDLPFTPQDLASLVQKVASGALTSPMAKKVLAALFAKEGTVEEIVKKYDLVQLSDSAELEAMIRDVLNQNPQVLDDLKNGKKKAGGFVVGQIMRATSGKANPAMINTLLEKIITNA